MTKLLRKISNSVNWNYDLVSRFARIGGAAGIIIHLLAYFSLHYIPGDMIGLSVRMLVVAAYIPLLFYPLTNWQFRHMFYLELLLVVTMPGYFSFLLLQDTNLYWSITLVVISITYGAFARWQVAVIGAPLAVLAAYGIIQLIYPAKPLHTEQLIEIGVIAYISMIIALLLKTYIENSHSAMLTLKRRADKQNQIFHALLDISVEVSRVDDLDEIFHLLLKRFETIYPGRGFGLLVEGPRPKIIPYMAFRGVSQSDTTFLLEVHSFVLGFASAGVKNNEETLTSIEGEDWQVFGGGIRTSSIQGQTLYCFKLFIKGRSLDSHERKTLEVFLETIRGMTRSRIQSLELERYSNTDQLTGLFNRNYFDRVIAQWQHKARPEKPFSVVFGDINGLKRINDTYGHQAGDALITACAKFLHDEVRNSDLVFRLGGDEVVILCPSTDLQQVQKLVSRIELKMAELMVSCLSEESGEVTDEQINMSFGAACSLEEKIEDMVALADKRMLEQKKRWYSEMEIDPYR